jgi:PAS domain S-box-containing protein
MTKKKILIVEDEIVTAMDIEDTLTRHGYEIAGTATNGADAIRIAKEIQPDLILMDIRIEGQIDGVEVANEIGLFYEIPIIFLTAYSDDLTISRVIKTKSFSFLLKPFNERELSSNIEMAINKNQAYQKSMAIQRIMESMFDLIAEGIISVDDKGMILRVNSATERMMGITREEVAGKPFWDTIPLECEHKEILATFIEEAKKSGESIVHWPYPVMIRALNGEKVVAGLTIELLMLQNNTVNELIYILSLK